MNMYIIVHFTIQYLGFKVMNLIKLGIRFVICFTILDLGFSMMSINNLGLKVCCYIDYCRCFLSGF